MFYSWLTSLLLSHNKGSRVDACWSQRVTEKIIQTNDEEELRKRGYLLGKTLGEGSYAKVSHPTTVRNKIYRTMTVTNKNLQNKVGYTDP